MKNILNIIRHDSGKLTSSVVAIITIMGLCIIPCLYAWFNIFSNWAPYDADATGRILVAVANEDRGSEMMGLKVNVGDKIADSLKANDAIGWRFVDNSEDAVEGVRAGDYYAALIIPEDFSIDVMSFVSGSFKNPQLIYYENEKKNAIAPKITGKAKTAVQEQVNATFVETLARYVSDAASVMDASGYDPQKLFSDLEDKMALLSERLDNCKTMLDAANGLADSAASLMEVSDRLLGSAEVTIEGAEGVVDTASDTLPKKSKVKDSVSDKLKEEKKTLDKDLTGMNKDITDAALDLQAYNEYVEKKLAKHRALVERMRQLSERTEKYLEDLGFTVLAGQFGETADRLADIEDRMAAIEKADETTWDNKRAEITRLSEDIDAARKHVEAIDEKKLEELDADLQKTIADARASLKSVRKALNAMEGDLVGLADVL